MSNDTLNNFRPIFFVPKFRHSSLINMDLMTYKTSNLMYCNMLW